MADDIQGLFGKYNGRRDEIIPLLQDVQNLNGYLTPSFLKDISDFTGVPASSVYAIATFYAQFRFTPIGKTHVMVCRGTACHVNGAQRVLEDVENQLDLKEGQTSDDLEYSLETVACIGACSLAPCIMVNDDVEAKITKKKIEKIFPKVENDDK